MDIAIYILAATTVWVFVGVARKSVYSWRIKGAQERIYGFSSVDLMHHGNAAAVNFVCLMLTEGHKNRIPVEEAAILMHDSWVAATSEA